MPSPNGFRCAADMSGDYLPTSERQESLTPQLEEGLTPVRVPRQAAPVLSWLGLLTERDRPWLLDTFCKAGGAAMGYWRAGFNVLGVDIEPQPHYPFPFIQGDALTVGPALLQTGRFAAAHGSPPCQGYSRMNHVHKRDYPLLIEPTRAMFDAAGLPYVIENVEGAPLIDPITLCGVSFGLQVIRHRLFESNVPLAEPSHQAHIGDFYSPAGHGDPNWRNREANPHLRGVGYTDRCRVAMGIDWMNRDELGEAIPPAYTAWVGSQLLSVVESAAVA